MVNSGTSAASTTARTTGMYSGLQPAITALIATFSTVHGALFGGIASDHLLRVASRAPEHAQHPHRRRRDHRQPVAPAAREAQLVLVLRRARTPMTRALMGGDPERDLQDLRHSGVHALRAATRLEVGQRGAERLPGPSPEPTRRGPSLTVRSTSASVLDANEGGHGLDRRDATSAPASGRRAGSRPGGNAGSSCEYTVSDAPLAAISRSTGRTRIAGRAVALGDDDEPGCRRRSQQLRVPVEQRQHLVAPLRRDGDRGRGSSPPRGSCRSRPGRRWPRTPRSGWCSRRALPGPRTPSVAPSPPSRP